MRSFISFCNQSLLFTGVKGVSNTTTDGIKKVHLNDMFSVFAKVKGTPKYWQVARNDLVAKVKQLGPFHVFYTFSCGEMRWTEVFICLLRKKGYDIEIPDNWNGNEAELKVKDTDLVRSKGVLAAKGMNDKFVHQAIRMILANSRMVCMG